MTMMGKFLHFFRRETGEFRKKPRVFGLNTEVKQMAPLLLRLRA